jgi:hypothetical protein
MSNWLAEAIAKETAYDEGYEAGKQAAAEQIFTDLSDILRRSKTTLIGQQFYHSVLDLYITELKKKYGVN